MLNHMPNLEDYNHRKIAARNHVAENWPNLIKVLDFVEQELLCGQTCGFTVTQNPCDFAQGYESPVSLNIKAPFLCGRKILSMAHPTLITINKCKVSRLELEVTSIIFYDIDKSKKDIKDGLTDFGKLRIMEFDSDYSEGSLTITYRLEDLVK